MIPEMTDPLGKYWEQPPRSSITIDEEYALMNRAAFAALHEYSSSVPSGVYPGKMWKLHWRNEWYLSWYEEVPGDSTKCRTQHRKILISD